MTPSARPSKKRSERDPEFEALLEQVKTSRGFDFTCYKRATLMRRVTKRMSEVGMESFADYRDYLQVEPQEFTELFNTVLINVTSFFRDETAWEALSAKVIPRIVNEGLPGNEIRVWSAGCASGEEAYTLAILLAEALGDEQFRRRVKIYATDLDEDALSRARHATYSAKNLEPVREEWRRKYFEPQSQGFTFRSDLRRSIIFGSHDLLQDAPISRLDLLSCRNTLMYFNADAQGRIATRLHFALKPTGYIFLGKAEILQNHANLFAPLDLKHRIFGKVPGPLGRDFAPLAVGELHAESAEHPADGEMVRSAAFDAGTVPQIVVDSDGRLCAANREARSLFGLNLRDIGRPFKDLEISYRPIELRSLIEQVQRTRQPVNQPTVSWPVTGGEPRVLQVQADQVLSAEGRLLGVSVSFTNVTPYRNLEQESLRSKQDLETASEELQSANEELETTNEELQSTIEELETTNEELQSGNEEMETMNEELQSTNQEMQTVNDELRERSEQLNDVNAFLESILSGVNIGVSVVDANLNIVTWNRRCEDLWGLRREEAVGKHLLNLDVGLPVDRLKAPVKALLAGGSDCKDMVLDAVNRRGRKIRCQVSCAPRFGPKKEVRGVILVMEQMDEDPKEE